MELFEPSLNHEIFIAAITTVEVVAAITRRSRGGSIRIADATIACNLLENDAESHYQVIEITSRVINSAMTLAKIYGLRGYDAIQLAAGCELNVLCLTNGLNIAALRVGLMVSNPNNYP